MTLAEKLRFLADRVEDGKEFYISKYLYTYQNGDLMVFDDVIEKDCNFIESSLLIETILGRDLKLKPQWEFTEDEKAILRNLPEQYKWIARDDDDWTMGELFIYAFKPMKFNDTWIFDKGSVTDLDNFKHLFQSVQWSDDEPCEFRKYI